jgi:hypothetical protein
VAEDAVDALFFALQRGDLGLPPALRGGGRLGDVVGYDSIRRPDEPCYIRTQ